MLAHTMQDIAKVVSTDKGIGVVFRHKFAFDTASAPENKQAIGAIIRRLSNRDVSITFECLQKEEAPKDKEFEEKVDYLLKTFGGKIVERGRVR